ncbi:DUF1857-domain-containing protein [Amylocystis lapponica]|nr:DUF1857-domain-containing protein [Amylocystis lapponica]
MRVVAVTLPVNRPTDALQLTKAQLFAGLKVKARDAVRFVPVITSCKVLEEHPSWLLREAEFKDAPAPVRERVEFFPPSLVDFAMFSLDGAPQGRVTNLISVAPDGALLLTYTFALGRNDGTLDVGVEADKKEGDMESLAGATIQHTLDVVREMVQGGEINVG